MVRVYGISMEAQNGLVAFAETVANQVHNDITDKVESGDLPEAATESVNTHKQLVAMHILNGFRANGEDGELDYEYIEMLARHASENVVAA